jgi:hypothetical protein
MIALSSASADVTPLYEVVGDPGDNYTEVTGPGAPGLAPLTVTNQSTATSFSSKATGLSSATGFGVGGGYTGLASASASGTASAGLLVGIAEASASTLPTFKVGSTNPYTAIASAAYLIEFGDSLTLTSATLAPGTPVTWEFTVGFHTVRTTTGGGSASATLTGGAGSQSTMLTNPVAFSGPTQGPLTETETIQVSGYVGEVVSIGESLNIVASAEASAAAFGSETAILDATDTGVFYADPQTAGLELVSASGHDYASPGVGTPTVPEPSTWAMIVLGFAGLGYAARRRRTHATPA